MEKFTDRHQAGKQLARSLKKYAQQKNTIVLGLARGGMPVAYEVANALKLPLDVFIVRKLGSPGHKELAIGAIASGGLLSLNEEIFQSLHLDKNTLDAIILSEKKELLRRETLYRGKHPAPDLSNKTIILVDDGIATGASIQVAIKALRKHKPKQLIIAVPTASPESYSQFKKQVDDCICLIKPFAFHAVGLWYDDFSQTTDEEVISLLHKGNKA